MTDKVIEIQNLSKRYLIQGNKRTYGLRRENLSDRFGELSFFGGDATKKKWKNKHSQEVWALRDVSFDVKTGDSIGVIGNNGAGKSTLLKIISRITAPTSGKIRLTGRVGSLLEVGTGFHNELTGRENIYLNGSVLGMGRGEIDRKFDEIVAFSEIDTYLDTPVKYYSSGMRMRLAFSVAAHLEPEILLIDEVLSVGDIAFQKKSVSKMNSVVKDGRTVLFVSHNLAAVRSLCQQAVHIEHGKVKHLGEVESVLKRYIEEGEERVRSTESDLLEDNVSGIFDLRVLDSNSEETAYIPNDKPFSIRFGLKLHERVQNSFLTLKLFNDEMDLLLDSYDLELDPDALTRSREPGVTMYEVRFPGNIFTDGSYSFGFELTKQSTAKSTRSIHKKIISLDHVSPIQIFDNGSVMSALGLRPKGKFHVPLEWEILRNETRE